MDVQQAIASHEAETIEPAAIEALRAKLRGRVLVPGEGADYDAARRVWNAMIDRRPALIVRCEGAVDVIDAVSFAREHELPVSIRGGGHNVAGHAVCEGGLMIDLTPMRGVRVDPERRRAWVGGGATWGDVDRETQAFGLATPGGLISDTGVAGLTLSGGIGWLRGRYGLCIDNLVSADVVTAEGRLLRASESENSDLLWALRGGGGNFGVVTAFEFQLHAVGPTVSFCAPIYPLDLGGPAIRAWRDFLADKNDSIGSLVEFSTVPEDPEFPPQAHGKKVFTLGALYAGDAQEGERVFRPLRELGAPVVDFSGRMPYCEVQKLFDAVIPFGRYRSYWKSLYIDALPDALIDEIVARVGTAPSPNTLASIWNFGGATARVPADATAFGDRSMPYMFSIDSIWEKPEDDETNIAWTRSFWQDMQRHSAGGRMYLNFPGLGEEGASLLERTFGANYPRLARIKNKYDPDNLFRFNQNIVPGA
jgi:FAD/FMN-containing dehydrogenase